MIKKIDNPRYSCICLICATYFKDEPEYCTTVTCGLIAMGRFMRGEESDRFPLLRAAESDPAPDPPIEKENG